MTNSIKNIVSEAIFQATCEASSVDRSATLADINFEISLLVNDIKFDTVLARTMFLGFVETELRKEASSLYPAKMQMDQNGNYTTNQKLWA